MLELMIGLVVLGLLAALAYPSYRDSLVKGRRGEAVKALAQVQQAQERWRSSHPSYSSSLDDLKMQSPLPSGYYTISIAKADGGSYTAVATAAGPQSVDTSCASFTVALADGEVTYSSKDAGGVASTQCWIR